MYAESNTNRNREQKYAKYDHKIKNKTRTSNIELKT